MHFGTMVAPNQVVHVLLTRLVLLRTLIDEDTVQNCMPNILQNLSNKSRLAKHWIRNLIRPKSW